VTHLRRIMLEELQRRNYAEHTTRSYIRTVEDFARHFNCSPDRLGLESSRSKAEMSFSRMRGFSRKHGRLFGEGVGSHRR